MERPHQAKRDVERDIPVDFSVKQANGAINRDLCLEQQQLLARLPEVARHDLGVGPIWVGLLKTPLRPKFHLLLEAEAPVGEVRRRRDADEPLYSWRPLEGDV